MAASYVGVNTSLTISEPQARVWSFEGVFFVGVKPALLLVAAESASCGIDEDTYDFGNAIPLIQPPSTLLTSRDEYWHSAAWVWLVAI